jgi:hypothetical protein
MLQSLPGTGDAMARCKLVASVAACVVLLFSFLSIPSPTMGADKSADTKTPDGKRTSLMDIPWSEFQQRLGFRLPANYDQIPKIDLSRGISKDIPSRWDWREHDGTTPVQDQGNCGSCWAFAAVGAFEGCARLHDRLIYDLSEQQLLSCNDFGYGCNGGNFEGCFEVFRDPGAMAEECMPYEASDGVPCTDDACQPLAMASQMLYIDNSVEAIKAAVYTIGPIVVAMKVYSDFQSYNGQTCYAQHPGGEEVNHAIVVVGWDDAMCGGFGGWICKNSWGTGWGDDGYFYIRYGYSSIGVGAAAFIHIPGNTVKIRPTLVETTSDARDWLGFSADLIQMAGVPIDPLSVRLTYRVNGGEWEPSVQMLQGGSRSPWIARIPAPPKPATIDYWFHASDIEAHEGFSPVMAPDSCYSFDLARYFEDFEGPDTGWVAGEPDDDATSGRWECVEPLGTIAQPGWDCTVNGAKCWITGQHVEGQPTGYNDVDNGKTTLLSPPYDLQGSTTALVKYHRWFTNDKGSYPGQDPWIVQARNGDGAWVDLENTMESRAGWMTIERDLKAVLGDPLGQVRFRFIACDSGGPSCVEAAIDDFTILADDPQTRPEQAPYQAHPITSGALSPNPTTGSTRILFTLAENGPVQIEVYAADGRHVRTVATAMMAAGSHGVLWDGRDDDGRQVASGPYYCVSRMDGRREVQRVLIVR